MIDWTRVTELSDEVGAEDFEEVVELFLEEVEAAIHDLKAGTPDLEAKLHFLKGSALNLGFDMFAELCQAGELAAGAGAAATVDVEQIKLVYRRSCDEFSSSLQTRLAG